MSGHPVPSSGAASGWFNAAIRGMKGSVHLPKTAITALAILASLAGMTPGSFRAVATSTSRSACEAAQFTHTQARHVLRVAEARLTATNAAYQPGAFPSITDQAGNWQTVPAKQWTSGFFPGSLWLAYQRTGQHAFKAQARDWTHTLAGQATDTSTHDIGFQIMSSFGNGYAITHDKTYKSTIMRAAKSLATRYNPTVGAIRSWGARSNTRHFKVIIDNMMNLRLLFWASAHGGQRAWKHIAVRHALTTAAHFVRADGSVIHLVDFDPATGEVLGTANPQGYSADSTWARGQAWAAYGFTTAYAQTGNKQLLTEARRTADFFIAGLPADCVPVLGLRRPRHPQRPHRHLSCSHRGSRNAPTLATRPQRRSPQAIRAQRIAHPVVTGRQLRGRPWPGNAQR